MISLMETVFETSDLETFQCEMATFQADGMETFQTDGMETFQTDGMQTFLGGLEICQTDVKKIYQHDGLETSVWEGLNSELQQLLLPLELEIFGSFSLAVQQKTSN